MGSTRLPGKSMIEIGGKPLIKHLIERTRATTLIDQIVVATTTNPLDDPLASYVLNDLGVAVFRGSERDVLERYAAAAQFYGGDIIVRLTGDDPLKDPDVIDTVIETLIKGNGQYDYVSNTIIPTYPEGLDCEAFFTGALLLAANEATDFFDREHVTPYFYKNQNKFRCFNVSLPQENYSHIRWTLDTTADLDYFISLYTLLDDKKITPWRETLSLVSANEKLALLNRHSCRSDRYK